MSNQRKFHPSLLECLGIWWCRMMHNSPMWPISGHYRCRACGRNFVVSWAGSQVDEPVADVNRTEQRSPSAQPDQTQGWFSRHHSHAAFRKISRRERRCGANFFLQLKTLHCTVPMGMA